MNYLAIFVFTTGLLMLLVGIYLIVGVSGSYSSFVNKTSEYNANLARLRDKLLFLYRASSDDVRQSFHDLFGEGVL